MMRNHDAVGLKRSSGSAPAERRQVAANAPGIFRGWISERHGVAWVVSPHRMDRRTGSIPVERRRTYCLTFYSSGKPGRGANGELVIQFFEATRDMEAWRIAKEYMLARGVKAHTIRDSSLTEGDREVIKGREGVGVAAR